MNKKEPTPQPKDKPFSEMSLEELRELYKWHKEQIKKHEFAMEAIMIIGKQKKQDNEEA